MALAWTGAGWLSAPPASAAGRATRGGSSPQPWPSAPSLLWELRVSAARCCPAEWTPGRCLSATVCVLLLGSCLGGVSIPRPQGSQGILSELSGRGQFPLQLSLLCLPWRRGWPLCFLELVPAWCGSGPPGPRGAALLKGGSAVVAGAL